MRRSKEETRRCLLEAGVELLLANGLPEAINIKMADACDRLGVTSGAAYQIWRSQGHYQTELTHHIINTLDWSLPGIGAELERAATTGKAVDDALYSAAAAHFAALVAHPEFHLILHLWSVGELNPEQVDTIRGTYRRAVDELVGHLAATLDGFGLEPRPDYHLDALAMAITTLGEGLVVRHRFDPRPDVLAQVYADGLVALLRHYTHPIGSG